MNKSEAMKRLDAIEAEAKALRELISKPDKIVYEHGKLYCALKRCIKYLMVYSGQTYSFAAFSTVPDRWNDHIEPQDSIDDMIEDNGEVFVFNNKEDAFKFMLGEE